MYLIEIINDVISRLRILDKCVPVNVVTVYDEVWDTLLQAVHVYEGYHICGGWAVRILCDAYESCEVTVRRR